MAFLTLQISYLKLNKSRSGEEEFDNFLRRRTMRRLLWSLTKVKQAKRVGQTERGVLSKSADPNGKFWLISGDCMQRNEDFRFWQLPSSLYSGGSGE